jgi:dynein heavy chain
MTDLGGKEEGLAALCAHAHSTTKESAEMMNQELNRVFYVTPTNYLELLKGYSKILIEKRNAVDKQRNKLGSGLSKLEDAKRQVEVMAKTSDEQRVEVQKQSKDCEELMMKIAKERKEAEAQQVNIDEQTAKINKEKVETLQQQADVAAELKKCEPALLMAQEAIDKLDKKYIAEIKAFASPPPDVQTTMSAVMILLQKEPTWPSAKKELSDSAFIKKIMDFDKDNISSKVLQNIEKFTRLESFQPALVSKCNVAAGALCQWVRSLEDYSKALKVVAPKRARMAHAQEQLAKKEAMLKELTDEFEKLRAKLDALELEYNES